MKKAAILARVSTDSQEFQRQVLELKARAIKDGYIVPDEYIYAEKVSGFSKVEQRLELTRLLNDINDHKKDISIIYVSELSRLSRNPRIARNIIDEACDLGIPFYIEGIGKTLEEDGTRNMTTSIVIQVFAEYASKESETTKKRSKSGKRKGAMDGKWHGGQHLPFGYSKDPETLMLVINEEEAKIIRELYQMSIDGLGAVHMAKMLTSRGIPTRANKKEWDFVVVSNMIKNPLYKGYRSWKGELFPGMPAIVSEEVWEQAVAAMEARNVNRARNVKYLYLLKDKLWCGCCSKGYMAKYHISKAAHYMCYNRKFGKARCLNAGVGISQIESLCWTMVKNQPRLLEHLKNSGTELQQVRSDIKTMTMELELLERELVVKEKEKDRALRAFIKGAYGDGPEAEEKLEQDTLKLSKSIGNILNKMETLKQSIKVKKEWEVKISDLETYMAMVKDISSDRMKINEVLPGILDKVIINSVTPDSNSVEYIVTVWMYGNPKGYTVLFNKKTWKMWSTTPEVDQVLQYDEKGILQNDAQELARMFKKPIKVRQNGEPHYTRIRNVEIIPFTLVNVYEPSQELLETV